MITNIIMKPILTDGEKQTKYNYVSKVVCFLTRNQLLTVFCCFVSFEAIVKVVRLKFSVQVMYRL